MFQQSQETHASLATVGVEINNFTYSAALFSLKTWSPTMNVMLLKCRGVSSVTGLLDSDSACVTLSFPE
jgi:hypothetical protein